MEKRFVRVTHGDEADLNKALQDQAAEGWDLEEAYPTANGDVILLFAGGMPAVQPEGDS